MGVAPSLQGLKNGRNKSATQKLCNITTAASQKEFKEKQRGSNNLSRIASQHH